MLLHNAAGVLAAALAAGAVLVAGVAFGGALGVTVAAAGLAALSLLRLLARLPAGAAGREAAGRVAAGSLAAGLAAREPAQRGEPASGVAGTPGHRTGWRWLLPGRVPAPVEAADFAVFRKISTDLGWAGVSRWHYDHGLRPLLTRLAESAAERRLAGAGRDAAGARWLIGEDLWPLVDPGQPPSADSRSRGPDLRTLNRLVDRLEWAMTGGGQQAMAPGGGRDVTGHGERAARTRDPR
jgi:hypothetical protein